MYIKSMIEPEIATVSRHMFLYGNNTFKRERLLKGIAEKYPFVFGADKPSVVYVDDIGLPDIKNSAKGLDNDKVNSVASYYLEFSILEAILKKINQAKNKPTESINEIVRKCNLFSKTKHESLEEVLKSVDISKKYWANYYEAYVKTGDDSIPREYFDKLDMAFVPFLSTVTEDFQKVTNNKAPFQVILDRKKKIGFPSVMAINTLLGLRCNGSVSYKVACEPNEWETTHDLTGKFAEYVHDYTILELDESYEKSIKEAKSRYGIDEI